MSREKYFLATDSDIGSMLHFDGDLGVPMLSTNVNLEANHSPTVKSDNSSNIMVSLNQPNHSQPDRKRKSNSELACLPKKIARENNIFQNQSNLDKAEPSFPFSNLLAKQKLPKQTLLPDLKNALCFKTFCKVTKEDCINFLEISSLKASPTLQKDIFSPDNGQNTKNLFLACSPGTPMSASKTGQKETTVSISKTSSKQDHFKNWRSGQAKNQLKSDDQGRISQLIEDSTPTECEKNYNEAVYQQLIKIFPEADEDFIRQQCCLHSQINLIIEIILGMNNTYPKKQNCSVPATFDTNTTKYGLEDVIRLCTTMFDIVKFLNIIKDPISYYLDDNRTCNPNSHAIEFMKARYRYHSIKQINAKFKEFEYNLSKTCESLDIEKGKRKTQRSETEIRMPSEVNVTFLLEACFVEHKQEIREYLLKGKEQERLLKNAEERGELISCGCCYQELLFEDCAACNEGGHLFCKTCIKKGAEMRIGDGLTTFPCLMGCGSSFSLNLLQNLLEPQVFYRLMKRIQLDEIKAADLDRLEVCPFCEFAALPDPNSKVFICFNPDCMKESCRQCHKLSHIPQQCEEVESNDQEKARKYIENEMTRALVRDCYKCSRSYIKTDGCNKMTCTCGAQMCYICRQPVFDYTHFKGPGRCPLFSTDKALHVDAVAEVAKKALKKVQADNPELKLKYDPSKLLPSTSTQFITLPQLLARPVATQDAPPQVNETAGNLLKRLSSFLPRLNPINLFFNVQTETLPTQILPRNARPPVVPQRLAQGWYLARQNVPQNCNKRPK